MRYCFLPLILAGAATSASAEEVRRALVMTARVTESCTVATGGQPAPVSCTVGTRWRTSTGTTDAVEDAVPPSGEAARRGVRYRTFTY